MYRPSWFKAGAVVTSNAPTCGINKDGNVQYLVDPATGLRSEEVDDRLAVDVEAILRGATTSTVRTVPMDDIARTGIAVPAYYDTRTIAAFLEELEREFPGFKSRSVGELIESGEVVIRKGHGSPSLDQRTGEVPYIKVSDLRAGLVNINPTNMVPESLAKIHWKGPSSGLRAFDLISPERASKNIGDFCVLLPGQERVVLTKEVLVFRVESMAPFDSFYLLWALTLKTVRAQWSRVVLMQTNREDVGDRYHEILFPYPPSREAADDVSGPFRSYYQGLDQLRESFRIFLTGGGRHHFFVGSADEEIAPDTTELADEVARDD